MNIQVLLGVVAFAVVVYLLIQNGKKYEPRDIECVKEVIAYLKSNQHHQANEIADIYRKHERTKEDVERVTTLIKTKLIQAGFRKEEHSDIMIAVRNAKRYLSSANE